MRRSMYFGFLLLILGFSVYSLKGQDLQQVVQLALRKNKTVLAQMQQVKMTDFQAKAIWRRSLPQLNFESSYRHVTHVPEIEFPMLFGKKVSPIHLGSYDTYENSLMVSYTLFSGFALQSQIHLMAQQARLQKINLEKIRKEIAFKTVLAYRNVQRYQLELESLQAGIKRINEQLARVSSLIRQGMALALDSLSLTLAKLKLEQKQIAVSGQLKNAQDELRHITGRAIRVSPFAAVKPAPLSTRLLGEQSETIKRIKQIERIKKTQLTLAQSGYYPRVQLFASYNYGRPGLDMIRNEWMDYGVWGVSLHWNLFSWSADRLNAQAAKAAIKEIQWQKEEAHEQLQNRFNAIVREWQTLRQEYQVLQSSLEVAKTKMHIIAAKYKQGMATVTDFNRANLELTEAELKVKSQLVLLILKQNQIEYFSGKPIKQWSIRQ